jgi:hypothetical protein
MAALISAHPWRWLWSLGTASRYIALLLTPMPITPMLAPG